MHVGGRGGSYMGKVLGIGGGPIAYWPLSESSGTNAVNEQGTAARDGTFARNVTTMGTGTGIGDGNTAPDFDGTNDYCDVYSVSFRDAFNGAEGTVSLWAQVSGVGIWTDSTRHDLVMLYADASNYM